MPGWNLFDHRGPLSRSRDADDLASEDVASEDVASEDVASEDVASEDVASEDVASEDHAAASLDDGADPQLGPQALARLERVETSGMSWVPALRDPDAVELAYRLLQDLESAVNRFDRRDESVADGSADRSA